MRMTSVSDEKSLFAKEWTIRNTRNQMRKIKNNIGNDDHKLNDLEKGSNSSNHFGSAVSSAIHNFVLHSFLRRRFSSSASFCGPKFTTHRYSSRLELFALSQK